MQKSGAWRFTVIERDTRLKELLKHVVWNRLRPDMLKYDSHARAVSKATVLLIEPEVGRMEVQN